LTVQCVDVKITAAQGSEHFLPIILCLIPSLAWTVKYLGIAQKQSCEGDYVRMALGKIRQT